MKLIALYQILDVKEFYIFIIILKCIVWYRLRDYIGQMLWREHHVTVQRAQSIEFSLNYVYTFYY